MVITLNGNLHASILVLDFHMVTFLGSFFFHGTYCDITNIST
jgi:hypothetical protein